MYCIPRVQIPKGKSNELFNWKFRHAHPHRKKIHSGILSCDYMAGYYLCDTLSRGRRRSHIMPIIKIAKGIFEISVCLVVVVAVIILTVNAWSGDPMPYTQAWWAMVNNWIICPRNWDFWGIYNDTSIVSNVLHTASTNSKRKIKMSIIVYAASILSFALVMTHLIVSRSNCTDGKKIGLRMYRQPFFKGSTLPVLAILLCVFTVVSATFQ